MWAFIKRGDEDLARKITYGYEIKDGNYQIKEEEAEQIRLLFKSYLEGHSLQKSADTAGIKVYHGSAKRMLVNKRYIGDQDYPKIIDEETFKRAGQMLEERAQALGRVWDLKEEEINKVPTNFKYEEDKNLPSLPFERAKRQYDLIKTVGGGHGK